MEIKMILQNKKQYIDLLLLADEQESMIDIYLEKGTMFALYDKNSVKCVCVITREEQNIYEIKNLAKKIITKSIIDNYRLQKLFS